LVHHSANINCKDEAGCTPLHILFLESQIANVDVQVLPEESADSCCLNVDGKAAVHCAIENLSPEAFMAVIDAFRSRQGALEVKDSTGQTVLHYAVKTVNFNLIRRLLGSHIDSRTLNKYSQNALHLLVSRHFSNERSESQPVIQITDLLLTAHTDLLARNLDGRMALDIAVSNQNKPLVRHLVVIYLRQRVEIQDARDHRRERQLSDELGSAYQDSRKALKEFWATFLFEYLNAARQNELSTIVDDTFRQLASKPHVLIDHHRRRSPSLST
jgi:ankyrin repeat protein